MMNRLFFLGIVVLMAVSCVTPEPKEYARLDGFAQGSTYSIIYFDSLGRDFSEGIEVIIEQVDNSMSLYRENSIINQFNASSKGIEVDSLLAQVIQQSLYYSKITNGAFDITVGPLVKAWGFYGRKGEVPSDEEIQELKQVVGEGMIEIDGLFLSKKYPEVRIDVNAIAQGFTVDIISEYLFKMGVSDYLVELGGEIRTLGHGPRGDSWLIGIDKPEDHALSGENLQVILRVSGESLVTSGNYRKFYIREGIRYSHTIDPKTGYPVTHTLLSATAIDSTSAGADALATAFMAMGKKATIKWLENHPNLEAYLIYDDEQGNYGVWMCENMKKRVAD